VPLENEKAAKGAGEEGTHKGCPYVGAWGGLVNNYVGQDTNGASPQPDDACFSALLVAPRRSASLLGPPSTVALRSTVRQKANHGLYFRQGF
jgi:hypothetical protein